MLKRKFLVLLLALGMTFASTAYAAESGNLEDVAFEEDLCEDKSDLAEDEDDCGVNDDTYNYFDESSDTDDVDVTEETDELSGIDEVDVTEEADELSGIDEVDVTEEADELSGIDEVDVTDKIDESCDTDNIDVDSELVDDEDNSSEASVSEDYIEEDEIEVVILDEDVELYDSTVVNVTSYGANGSDSLDDFSSINEALYDAGQRATASSPVTVVIPKGTYYLSQGLTIYSNTILSVDSNATVIRMNDENVFITSPWNVAGGYDAIKNVTIKGGTWDGNVSNLDSNGYGLNAADLMYFCHGSNITICDLKLTECCGYHFIELAGIKDSSINNVTFENYIPHISTKYTGSTEAIQFDYCGEENSEGAAPFDNTVSKNIDVIGCTFNNVMGGVGNHHGDYGTSQITVKNCSFNNLYGFCIYLDNFKGTTVSECTGNNVTGFMLAVSTVATVDHNVVTCKTLGTAANMIDITGDSDITLTNNKVTGGGLSSLYTFASTLVATGNTFSGSTKSTVIIDNSYVNIKNNTLGKSAGTNSTIWVQNGSTGTIESNNITSSSMGIGLYECKSFNVISNTLSGIPDIAIQLSGPSGKTVIKNNTISKCNNDSILVSSASVAVEIVSNTITDSGKKGIEVLNSSNITINNNRISASVKEGIYVYKTTASITYNTISTSGTHGILGSGILTVLNNTISGSAYYDINLYDESGFNTSGTIKDNKISGDPNKMISAPSRMTIANNSASASSAGSSSSTVYTGMKQVNGTWYYYKDGVIDTSYTGLASYNDTWYYIQSGVLKWGCTSLVNYGGTWYYVQNSTLKWGYTGLVNYGGTWYYVQNSTLKWGYTGLVNYGGTWYYVQNSTLKWGYTGLVNYGGTWYYVQNSTLKWGYTGLVNYGGTWYYVQNSTLKWGYTGLVNYGGTWYYVQNSTLKWGCTSLVNYGGTWYYVQNSTLKWGYTGVVPYGGRYYYVTNSTLKWGINTLAQYGDKWYYFENSTLNFNYTGNFTYNGKTYRVVNGVVQF